MIKRYLYIYTVSNVGVNGSSQVRAGFAEMMGRGGSGKVSAGARSGRSDCFLIYEEAVDEHFPWVLEQPPPSGPEEITFLQAFSTFSSGVPRPRTISCGLNHCFFRTDIESSDSEKMG